MTETAWKLLACTNFRPQGDRPSCAGRESARHIDALEQELKSRNLSLPVERSICLGKCPYGPSLKATPGGAFYLGDWTEDIPGLVDRLVQDLDLTEADTPDDIGFNLPPPGT